jgi:hypothetical protein
MISFKNKTLCQIKFKFKGIQEALIETRESD